MVGQSGKVARGSRTIAINLAKMATETGKLETATGKATIELKHENGEMKSTFEIMSELYPIWKTLNNEQKTALAQNVAGKNQFEVFVNTLNNFQTALDATNTAMTSSGSAARENERYMQSLEARMNGLKTEFEDFVLGDGAISSFIKLIISAGTSILKFANSDIGQAIIKISAFMLIIKSLKTSIIGLNLVWGAFNIGKWAMEFAQGIAVVTAGVSGLSTVTAAFTAIWNLSPFVVITAIIGAIYGFSKAVDALTISFEEQQQIVADLTSQLNSMQSEYDVLVNKSNRNAYEEEYLNVLRSQIDLLKQRTIEEAKTAYKKFQTKQALEGVSYGNTLGQVGAIIGGTYGKSDVQLVEEYTQKISDVDNKIKSLDVTDKNYINTLTKLKDERSNLVVKQGEYIDGVIEEKTALQQIINLGGTLGAGEQARLDRLNELIVSTDEATVATNGFGSEISDIDGELEQESEEVVTLIEALNGLSSSLSVVSKAFKDFSDDGELSYSTLSNIYDAFSDVSGIDDYINRLADANLTSQEMQDIFGELAMAKAQDVLATQGVTDASQNLITKLLQEAGVSNAAEIAAYLVANALEKQKVSALNAKSALDGAKNATIGLGNTKIDTSGIVSQLDRITNAASRVANGTAIMQNILAGGKGDAPVPPPVAPAPAITWSGVSYSGGGGGGGSAKDPLEEQSKIFKEQIDILEYKLFLQQQIAGTEGQQILLQKQIQEELHKQADWYRAKGEDENSEYIRALSEQWWKYEKTIKDLYKDIAKARKEALEKEKDDFEKAIDYYTSLIDDEIDKLENQKDAIKDRYDVEIDKLKEVNDELDNQIERERLLENLAKAKSAQKLVYKDGKYQYVSDISAVSEAQATLSEFDREQKLKAETKALEDARDAEVKAIDDQIQAWKNYQKEWTDIVDGYQREQDRLIAEQILGINLEKFNWNDRLINAQEFAKKYNSIMSQIGSMDAIIEGKAGASNADAIRAQMEANSKAWYTADASEKARLAAENQALGKLIGAQYTSASGQWAYANGTTSAQGGLSTVGEQGREMRVLNKGDGIIPHTLTENLMELGKFSPAQWLSKLGSTVNNAGNTIINQFDKIVLPNVTDGNSFVRELKNFKQFAIQQGNA